MLSSYLSLFNQEMGLSLEDEGGSTSLSIDDQCRVHIKDLKPGVYFHSKLAPCPKEKKEVIFSYLIRGNFLGQGTAGSSLGLDPDGKFLTLSYAIPYEIDYRGFKDSLEEFVNFAHFWAGEIERIKNEEGILGN